MKIVKILDKEFGVSIPAEKIQSRVIKLAEQFNNELREKDVIFLGILNGSFMFAADLFKFIEIKCQISFLKIASYSGTSSSGTVKSLIGINEELRGKTVIILEDIIDSGITMENIIRQLNGFEPAEIKICTLLFKPLAFKMNFKIDYIGFEIPNDFVVGYGLDYDGFGRNLPDIYKLV